MKERVDEIVQDERTSQHVDILRVRICPPSNAKASFSVDRDPYGSRDNRLHPVMMYIYKKETGNTKASISSKKKATSTTTKTMQASTAMLKLFSWTEEDSNKKPSSKNDVTITSQQAISMALKEYEMQRRLWELDCGLFMKPIAIVRGWEGEIENEREYSSTSVDKDLQTNSNSFIPITSKRITECVEGDVEKLTNSIGIVYEQCTGLTLATWLAGKILKSKPQNKNEILKSNSEANHQVEDGKEEEKGEVHDKDYSLTSEVSLDESKANDKQLLQQDEMLSSLMDSSITISNSTTLRKKFVQKGDPAFYHDGLGARVRGGGRPRDPLIPLKQQQEISLASTAKKTLQIHSKSIPNIYPSFGRGKTQIYFPELNRSSTRATQSQATDQVKEEEITGIASNESKVEEEVINTNDTVIQVAAEEVPRDEEPPVSTSDMDSNWSTFPLIDRLTLLERMSDILAIAHDADIILEGFHPGSFLAINLHQQKSDIDDAFDDKCLIWKYLYDCYCPAFMSRYDSFEQDAVDATNRIKARIGQSSRELGSVLSSPSKLKNAKSSKIVVNETTKAINCCNFGWICLEVMTLGLHPIPTLGNQMGLTQFPHGLEPYPLISVWEIGNLEIFNAITDYPLMRSMFADQEQIDLYIHRCLSPYKQPVVNIIGMDGSMSSFRDQMENVSPFLTTNTTTGSTVSSSDVTVFSEYDTAFIDVANLIEKICTQCLSINPINRCECYQITEIVSMTMSISMDHLTLLPRSINEVRESEKEENKTSILSAPLLSDYVPPADDGAGCLAPALWEEPCVDLRIMTRLKEKSCQVKKLHTPLLHKIKKVSVKRPLPRSNLSEEEAKYLRLIAGKYLPSYYGHCSLLGLSYVVEHTAFGSLEHFFSLLSSYATPERGRSSSVYQILGVSPTGNPLPNNSKSNQKPLLVHQALSLLPTYKKSIGEQLDQTNQDSVASDNIALIYDIVALQWVHDLLRAIHHLHYLGYSHGHLTPANVWVYPSSSSSSYHTKSRLPQSRLTLKLHGIHLIERSSAHSQQNPSEALQSDPTPSGNLAIIPPTASFDDGDEGPSRKEKPSPMTTSATAGASNGFNVYEAIECKFGHHTSQASDIFSFGMLALFLLQGDGKDPKPFEMESQLRRILSSSGKKKKTKIISGNKRYLRFPILEQKLLRETPKLSKLELLEETHAAREELVDLILSCFKFDCKTLASDNPSNTTAIAAAKEAVSGSTSQGGNFYGRFTAADLERKFSRWLDDVLCDYSIDQSSGLSPSMILASDWWFYEELMLKVMTGKESLQRLAALAPVQPEAKHEDEVKDVEPEEDKASLLLQEVDYARVVIQSTSTTTSSNTTTNATTAAPQQKRLKHATMAAVIASSANSSSAATNTFTSSRLRSVGYGLLYHVGYDKEKVVAATPTPTTSGPIIAAGTKVKVSAIAALFGTVSQNSNNGGSSTIVEEIPVIQPFTVSKEPEPPPQPPAVEIMQVTVSILNQREFMREAQLLHLLARQSLLKNPAHHAHVDDNSDDDENEDASGSDTDGTRDEYTDNVADNEIKEESPKTEEKTHSTMNGELKDDLHSMFFLTCFGFTYPNASAIGTSTSTQLLDFAMLYECPSYGTLQSFLFSTTTSSSASGSSSAGSNTIKKLLIPSALRLLWVLDMVKAVSYLHDTAGLVHGDLQPDHIYISSGLRLKVGGFSCCAASPVAKETVAKALANSIHPSYLDYDDEEEIPPTNLLYMAPELRIGLTAPSCAGDVFALAMIGVQLFTLTPPTLATPMTALRSQMETSLSRVIFDIRLRKAIQHILSPCFPPPLSIATEGEGEPDDQDVVALSMASVPLRPTAQVLENSITRLLKGYHWLSSPIPVSTLQKLLCPVTRNPTPQQQQLYEYLTKSGNEVALHRLVVDSAEGSNNSGNKKKSMTRRSAAIKFEPLVILSESDYDPEDTVLEEDESVSVKVTKRKKKKYTGRDPSGIGGIGRYKLCRLMPASGYSTTSALSAPPTTVSNTSPSPSPSPSTASTPSIQTKKLFMSAVKQVMVSNALASMASAASANTAATASVTESSGSGKPGRRASLKSFSTSYSASGSNSVKPPPPPPPPSNTTNPATPAATPGSTLPGQAVCLKFPFPGEEEQLLREALCLSKILTTTSYTTSYNTAYTSSTAEEVSSLLGCHGYARYDAGFFLVLEASPLGSIEDLLQEHSRSLMYTGKRAAPFPLNILAGHWLRDIARGLAALHAKGFVHARLSPRKCLLFYGGGRVKVGGLSHAFKLSERERDREKIKEKERDKERGKVMNSQSTHNRRGSVKEREKVSAYVAQYLAPELKYSLLSSSASAGSIGVGYTSDIYSLTVIALQLLAVGLPVPPRKNVMGATAVTADAMKSRDSLIQELQRVMDLRFPRLPPPTPAPPIPQPPPPQVIQSEVLQPPLEEEDEVDEIGDDIFHLFLRCLSYDESVELEAAYDRQSSFRDNLTYGRPTARKFDEILSDIIRRSELVDNEAVRLSVREDEANAFDAFMRDTIFREDDESEEEEEEEEENVFKDADGFGQDEGTIGFI